MSVRRFAALTTVLTGGALAALPFYKPPPGGPESPVIAPEVPEQGRQPTLALASGLQALPVPQIAFEATPSAFEGEASPASQAKSLRPPEWFQPSPVALANDDMLLPELPQQPVVRRTSHDRSAATIHEPDFSDGELPVESPPVKPPPPPRRHRIVDGDSLPAIALRYLGDEHRAAEILAINRDILRDPALLPVGKTLLIPRDAPAEP